MGIEWESSGNRVLVENPNEFTIILNSIPNSHAPPRTCRKHPGFARHRVRARESSGPPPANAPRCARRSGGGICPSGTVRRDVARSCRSPAPPGRDLLHPRGGAAWVLLRRGSREGRGNLPGCQGDLLAAGKIAEGPAGRGRQRDWRYAIRALSDGTIQHTISPIAPTTVRP